MTLIEPGRRRQQRLLLVVIVWVALALRVLGLLAVPPGLRYDELQNYLMVGRILGGEWPFYFAESWGHEPLFHYVQAAVVYLVQESGWSLRLPAVLSGVLLVVTSWLVARQLFGPAVGVVAAGTTALSFWAIFYSRVGLRLGMTAPVFCLMVYFLARSLEPRSGQGNATTRAAVAAGLLLGTLSYVYPSGRMGFVMLAAIVVYLALWRRPSLVSGWKQLLMTAAIGLLLVAPLAIYLQQSPGLQQRGDQLVRPLGELAEGRPGLLLEQAARAAGMFVWQGEQDWLYNVAGRPIFDPVTAAVFLVGAAVCLRRWRRWPYGLLLVWLAVGLMPSMVTLPAASVTHSVVAMPAAHIVLAIGIVAFARRVSGDRRQMAPAMAMALVAIYGAISVHSYFRVWSGESAVQTLYQGGVTAVARDLEQGAPPGAVAIGAPYVDYWQPWNAVAFELTPPPGPEGVRWFNPAGALVWPAGPMPVTYYFPADPLGPQVYDEVVMGLLSLVAVPEGGVTGRHQKFRVASNSNLNEQVIAVASKTTLAWPPHLSGLPGPSLPLNFGGRLALLAVEALQAAAIAGGEARLVSYWEVLAADATPLVAFVHLVSADGTIWGQQDWLDVRMAGLQPGDRFVQVFRVQVRPETAAGSYQVLLGVYRPDTLARLELEAGSRPPADHVQVARLEVRR